MNNVTLTGRLTRDPELKQTNNGISTCQFSLAVDRDYKPKDNQAPTADFPTIVAWRQNADYICQYGAKGDLVEVIGRLQTRNYEDSSGKKVYVTEVVSERLRLYTRQKQDKGQNTSTRRATTNNPTINGEAIDFNEVFDAGERQETGEYDNLPFY